MEITKYYKQNLESLFHGKEVFKRVKSLIQEFIKNNAKIEISTNKLIDEKLQKISSELWK